MNPRDSLRWRIAVAYLLFALGSTLFFSVTAAIAVEGIEDYLVDRRLEEVAQWALPRAAGGLPVALPTGLSFHQGGAIPLSLRSLPAGVHEVEVDGVGLHVLSGAGNGGPYVVVDHDSDYEKVEQVVYSLFALAFAGSLLFSVLLGRFIGRRLVSPITALADAVQAGSAELPLIERQDELGVLARAFAAHSAQLRGFLARERFFTGDVSHELRTPLTIITGAAEILAAQGETDPRVAAPAERILRAAREAAECVNVLLMLARSPARQPHRPVDIGPIAEHETQRYQALVADKDVQLAFAGGQAFSVEAQPELCAAAIGNLVRNACQYTERGSVTVRLGHHTVTVEDTGPGLPEAVRAGFIGEAGAAEGTSTGAGLGLGLVRRICEHLGASVVHQAREGGGSVFELRFPAALTKS